MTSFAEQQAVFARTLPKLSRIAPDSGPHPLVAHVFADLDGTGRCVCGKPLMVGVHVAPTDERDELRRLAAQHLDQARDAWRDLGEALRGFTEVAARLGVMEADR
jgi:hypothetical protein